MAKAKLAKESDIEVFRDALEKMGITLGQFCQMVAVAEGEEDQDKERKLVESVKRSFGRKAMKASRLQTFWQYLSEQKGFEKLDYVILPSANDFLDRSRYAASILAAFED